MISLSALELTPLELIIPTAPGIKAFVYVIAQQKVHGNYQYNDRSEN